MYKPGPEYPNCWNRQRFAIFKSVGYRCTLCGRYAKGNLCLHHIVPIKISHNNNPNNLQVLCNQCHYMIHQEYIENKKRFSV